MASEQDPNHELQLGDALARIAQLDQALAETQANAIAVVRVMHAVSEAPTANATAKAALEAVLREFGWTYGSYWILDSESGVLRFAIDSGETNDAFRRVTMSSTFAEGVGFNGRTWKARDLVFVKDIGELSDCARAPVAKEMGIRSGVCFPILVGDDLVGTMDFFVNETLELSAARMEALRNVARLVSAAFARLYALEREQRNAIVFQTTVTKLAKDLTDASAAISHMTATQTTISQNQATAIAQLSTTMTELRQMAIHTMDGAQSVIDVSQRALAGASEGRTAVDDTVRGMHEIRDKVREIGTKIATLSEQTKQIGEIIISVGEIAEQSRLLALNAAMEAARAGVHGRGFSVVAGEIRSLANQSKEATVQVRKILQEIKHATDATVTAMDSGVKNVESGVALASRAGESIESLSRFVGEAAEAARFIATSSRQQSAGVSQAAEAIGIINGDSIKVLEVVRQANEMVDSLETKVLDITALVSRLDGAEDTSRAGTA